MEESGKLLLELFLMFGAGKLLAEISERLGQPGVFGELAAGVLLGPSLLNWVRPDELTIGLAQIGAIFLLFTVGLETEPADLLAVGGTATLVATLGVLFPFLFGFFYMKAVAQNTVEAFFVAAAMVATSVGITARVLADLNAVATRAARVILAAAVLDDILGLLVLAIATSLSQGHVRIVQLVITSAETVAFALALIFFGPRVIGRFEGHVAKLRARSSAFILAVLLCLGLSLASVYIGMAAIVGSFLAGLALAERSEVWKLRESAHPLSEFLAPFFFVLLGVQVNLHALVTHSVIVLATVICLLAIAGKLVGCGLGAGRLGRTDALRVAVGMVPRGEVGMIVAGVGLALHTISDAAYAVVLLMSVVTTLVAPPVLRVLLRGAETSVRGADIAGKP